MKIYERDEGRCRQCGGQGEEIHHIYFKSRGGRGVMKNGLTLCNECHRKAHSNNDIANYWIGWAAEEYGPDFYKDVYDL
ncbi:5-methylcytosine-specific restriction endonuclease McrA [Virgibacillus natechei]|uniref:5-methylcytosine-specific restriction endonuclease McrA n=2 Tax=Virgibacillus natechei TaxID=1216297 RepID=A0ABS4IKY5_9BACI|nr:5-methylcytosine-specific restriction endonuclease McrA [Virgibacillus natechei]